MDRKRNRKKTDSYLNYDDAGIDLAEIFGDDYTEFEEEIEESEWEGDEIVEKVVHKQHDSSSSEDGEENSKRQKKPKTQKTARKKCGGKQKTSPTVYKCTECDKELKTIAGLRGHLSTQHAITNIKAADYRLNKDQESPVTSQRPLSAESDFKAAYPDIVKSVLKYVTEESSFSKGRTVAAQNIVACSKKVDEPALSTWSWKPLYSVISKLDGGVTVGASREMMFANFHMLKDDQIFLEHIYACGIRDMPHKKQFVQVLLRKILEQCIQNINTLTEKVLSKENDLSQEDQEVLYYIAGYFVRNLMKSSVPGADDIIKQGKVTDSTTSTFKDDFSAWTSKVSRGGLLMASDSMFLFVRSIENVVRKCVNTKSLSQTALLAVPIREAIMEDFLVKHYWGKLAHSVSTKSSCLLLEKLVSLFQRVRGNAVAKLARRKLQKDAGSQKKQKALRKELRDKTNTK